MDMNNSVIGQAGNVTPPPAPTPNFTPGQQNQSIPFYGNPGFSRNVGVTPGTAAKIPPRPIGMMPTTEKPKRVHGFFRTLMILLFIIVGLLMIGESAGIINLAFEMPEVYPTGLIYFSSIYPYVIVLGSFILLSYKKVRAKTVWFLFFLIIIALINVAIFYKMQSTTTHFVFNDTFNYKLHDIIVPTSVATSGDTVPTTTEMEYSPANIRLEINGIAGTYSIDGTDISNTIQGKYRSDRGISVVKKKTDQEMFISMTEDPTRNVTQWINSRMQTHINTNFIVDLYVKTFRGYMDVDLSKLTRTNAKLHLGVGDVTVRLGENTPHAGQLQINGLWSNVKIIVPKDLWVMLNLSKIYSTLNIPDFAQRDSSTYQSNNYDTADKKIQISVAQGIGNIDIIYE